MSVNKLFCEISAFLFQNVFIALLFFVLVGVIYFIFIRKASNITQIIYFLLVIEIAAGGFIVRGLLGKEDPESDIMIDSYYLGILELITLVALLASIVMDFVGELKPKKETKKKEIKDEPKEVKTITKEEALELAKDEKEEKPKKSLTLIDKWMIDVDIQKKAKEDTKKEIKKEEKEKTTKKKTSTTKKTTTKKTTKKPVTKK